MPITPTDLGIRFESDLVLEQRTVLVYRYEVFHRTWVPDTIVEEAMIWQDVATLARINDADAALQGKLAHVLARAQQRHQSVGSIGYSITDIDLIWQHWIYEKLPDGRWHAAHPLSGEFTGNAENTPVGRTQALLSLVLGPPAWAWADAPGPGQLRTKCVAVNGAASYRVYHDLGGGAFELLGDVPNANLNTLAVEPGDYTVRVAAVGTGGRVGILSRPVPVTVGGASAPVMDVPEPRDVEPEPEAEPAADLTRGDRFVRWLWGKDRYDAA